jgi:hypothetical protein
MVTTIKFFPPLGEKYFYYLFIHFLSNKVQYNELLDCITKILRIP